MNIVYKKVADLVPYENNPRNNDGAENKNFDKGMIQKTMTTFLMRADDVQYFNMRMNDDITTSLINGMWNYAVPKLLSPRWSKHIRK